MNGKLYCLYPCEVSELGKAADHTFLIVGFLYKEMVNQKYGNNKNVALGSKMNFILSDGKNKNSNTKPDSLTCIFTFLQLHTFLLSTNSGNMQVDPSIYECK